jgi:hypothetical protein
LTAQSVATAAAEGHGLPALLDALAALDLSLAPGDETQLFYWHQRGAWPRLELLPVLRTANRSQLAQLYADPHLANLLGDPLNSTTATWCGDPDTLIRRLRTTGLAPAVGFVAPALAPASETGQAGALWLAAQLYSTLGRHLALPFALPSALVDTLYRALDEPQRALLHAHLDRLVQEFGELLDGLTPLPSPYPSDPEQCRDSERLGQGTVTSTGY